MSQRWTGGHAVLASGQIIDKMLNIRRIKGVKDVSYYAEPVNSQANFKAYESVVINEVRKLNYKKPFNIQSGCEISKFVDNFDRKKHVHALAYLLKKAVCSPCKIYVTTDDNIAKSVAAISEATRVFMQLYEDLQKSTTIEDVKKIIASIKPLESIEGVPCKRIRKPMNWIRWN